MNTVTVVRVGNDIVVNGKPLGDTPITDKERSAVERFLQISKSVKIKSSVFP
ncbi:MAG TPA: hypothetical protein PKE03_10100 [Bacteroidales bacterium]|nr:hypothetical protein [Bacteroidales bacterium]